MGERLGQHFLHDEEAAREIVCAADIGSCDRVIEIGPGKGALTGLIARAAGELAAVELDEHLCRLLRRKFAASANVRIIPGNFLDVEPGGIFPRGGGKIKVVGNIPYYITTPILEKLFALRDDLDVAVLTVQKEVAQRMCSGPGTKLYGALSVFVGLNAKAGIVAEIGRDSFRPPPGVDSAVVRLDVLPAPPVPGAERENFSRFVKSMFAQKRKMVHNALQRAASLDRAAAERLLRQSGIDGTVRPEKLPAGRYLALFKKLSEIKG